MSTLYLRNVPDDVADRLARLAAAESMTVSALAVRELSEASRRADNAALLAGLPDRGIGVGELIGLVDAGRRQR
jgi:predicted transcriptional regulator